jgi:hypothetical protein
MEEKESVQEANRWAHKAFEGGAVADIPMNLVQKVRDVLASWKVGAIQKGQTETLRHLQSLIAQIDKRSENNSKKRTSRSSTASSRESSRFSESEVDSVLDEYVETQKEGNIPPDMLGNLISRSSKRIRDFLDSGDLISAQKYDNAHKRLITIKNGHTVRQNQTKKKRDLEELLEKVKAELEEEKHDLQQHLNEHNEQTDEAKQLHRAEWQEALDKWNRDATCENIPPEYRRWSVALLNMKQTEKALIDTRRFEEAHAVRAEVDELEQSERQENRKHFDEAMQKRKQMLDEKYKHKLECIEQNAERNKVRIEHEHQCRIETMELSISNLEKRIRAIEGENLTSTRTELAHASRPVSASRPRTSLVKTRPASARTKAIRGECPRRQAPEKVKVVYRPIMSKWRIQSPESMAPVTLGIRKV